MSKDFTVKNINIYAQKNICAVDNVRTSKPQTELFQTPSKIVLNPPKQHLFTTSSGKTYDLKQLINDRIDNLFDPILNDLRTKKTFKDKICDWYKKNLANEIIADDILDNIFKMKQKIYRSADIKILFEYATGQKYSKANLEKFVKGEIKLKLEQDFKSYKGEDAAHTSSIPYLSKNFQESKDKEKVNGKVFKLDNKEQVKYNVIKQALNKEYQEKLSKALTLGKLNQDKSESRTVLDSLHKILTTPRVNGLDAVKIVQECLDILENPNIITQIAEDIPEEYLAQTVKRYYDVIDKKELYIKAQCYSLKHMKKPKEFKKGDVIKAPKPTRKDKEEYIKEELQQRCAVSTCAAASLEYNLATKQPANFFNIVEKLTSLNGKIIKSNKQQIKPDMNKFNINLTGKQPNSPSKELFAQRDSVSRVELKADSDAYNLARIQNNHKNRHERSMVDILLQSMIMNLASGGIYNSLTDRKKNGEVFIMENSGLYNHEIYYAKNVLENSENVSQDYAVETTEGRLFLTSKQNIKQQLLDLVKRNENIVIGYSQDDFFNHEITIIDYITNDNGEGFFVCQDSCDEEGKPTLLKEDFILSNIVHAQYRKDNTPPPPSTIANPNMRNRSSMVDSLLVNNEGSSLVVTNDCKILTPWNNSMKETMKPINNQ